MADTVKILVDDDGNPIAGTPKVYVDDNGNPIKAEAAEAPSTATALTGAAAKAVFPVVRKVVEEVATNPNLVKNAKATGQVVGGLGGVVKAGPLGLDSGARLGGKSAAITATAAQKVAAPTAAALEKLAPYTQALSTLSGAQGVLDLAQMAEPNRKDIGFFGIGPTVHVPGEEKPLLNAAYDAVRDAINRWLNRAK